MLKTIISGIIDAFLPGICLSCQKPAGKNPLCPDCLNKLRFLTPPLCRKCSYPIKASSRGLCQDCFQHHCDLDQVISLTAYQPPIDQLIKLFKYQNYQYLLDFFDQLICQRLSQLNLGSNNYDCVTCVPMHPAKRKARDYNHAWLLAKKIAKYFKIKPQDDIIYESQKPRQQAKLDSQLRQANVSDAFFCKQQLTGKRILIVDDVFTTGATLRACAAVLKKHQAQSVTAITLAKTL